MLVDSHCHLDFDAFAGTLENASGDEVFVNLASDTLEDWGLYSQVLWGFVRGWAAGVRFEYGDALAGRNFDLDSLSFVSPDTDPYRDRRLRVSPLLTFHPSEFSRLRLQYNYDRLRHLENGKDVHGVWAGVEFLFGQHPAHHF